MLLRITTTVNLVWQSILLLGVIESLRKLALLGFGEVFTFGFVWPTLLWASAVLINLYFLIYSYNLKTKLTPKKQLLIGILLIVAPIIVSYVIGNYYQLNVLESISK